MFNHLEWNWALGYYALVAVLWGAYAYHQQRLCNPDASAWRNLCCVTTNTLLWPVTMLWVFNRHSLVLDWLLACMTVLVLMRVADLALMCAGMSIPPGIDDATCLWLDFSVIPSAVASEMALGAWLKKKYP